MAKDSSTQKVFIDKFVIPPSGKNEFLDRMTINRNFIRNLDGFIRDDVYERTDDSGNIIVMTIAIWENEEVLDQAKKRVQKKYQEEKFDMKEMFDRLNITMERNTYHLFDSSKN